MTWNDVAPFMSFQYFLYDSLVVVLFTIGYTVSSISIT